jgi:S-adenosylmethionine:tRNA ribosyltransferase-isomerase
MQRLEAHEPAELRGSGRDDVAMMVASRGSGELVHARFDELTHYLAPGDVLVVNTSATVPAALEARLDGQVVELRLSTPVGEGAWVVELRTTDGGRLRRPPLGSVLELPGDARAMLIARYAGSDRLAVAHLELDAPVEEYLDRYGHPVQYGYLSRRFPLEAFQTVFAREPGSAEMASAGRPFTTELVAKLVAAGVLFAPVTLHTGVSSLELGERPYPERYRVPELSARIVNLSRAAGGHVIAVGTTAVRAIETVASPDGTVGAGEGWTDLVITPQRGMRTVDGLLTGWHEPDASHLELLEALAGAELLDASYREAIRRGYLWHEFGDVHLILP